MEDDVVQALHVINERFKRLEAALKAESDERVQVGADLKNIDIDMTRIKKSMGGWDHGDFGKKVEDIEKRVDAVEKKLPKK